MVRSPQLRVLPLYFVQHRKDHFLRPAASGCCTSVPSPEGSSSVGASALSASIAQRLVHHLLRIQPHLAAARQQRSLQHHLVAQVRLVLLQVVQPHPAVPVQVGFSWLSASSGSESDSPSRSCTSSVTASSRLVVCVGD